MKDSGWTVRAFFSFFRGSEPAKRRLVLGIFGRFSWDWGGGWGVSFKLLEVRLLQPREGLTS